MARMPHATHGIREIIFGDVDLGMWPAAAGRPVTDEPWVSFVRARTALARQRTQEAVALLLEIRQRTGLESRHYLVAWKALRGVGVQPSPEEAVRVFGVVVEVGLEGGEDIVAGYAAGTARYLNYSGAGVVWEAPDDALRVLITRLMAGGADVARQVGVWTGPLPPPVAHGEARLSVLTPAGLRFGQASLEALMGDGLAGPTMAAAFELMTALSNAV